MNNIDPPCKAITCGFTNTYFGLCQTVAFLSIILFNSTTGMNENENCLYKAIQLFVKNAEDNADLTNEKNRFTEIMEILTNEAEGYLAVFYSSYNFDKFTNFIKILSKVKTTGGYEQNKPLEYEIINNLLVNDENLMIMFKPYLSVEYYELANFMNVITYTLNNKYIDFSFVDNSGTPDNIPLGYIIQTHDHLIPLYLCGNTYSYIDWGKINNYSNFNDIISRYKSENTYKINIYTGQIYLIDTINTIAVSTSAKFDNIKNIDNITNIFKISMSDKLNVLTPYFGFSSPSSFHCMRVNPDTSCKKLLDLYVFDTNTINVRIFYDIITFDILYKTRYRVPNMDSRVNIVIENIYKKVLFIYSMILSTNYSIIYKFVNKIFRYIECIDGDSSTTEKQDYNEYIQLLTNTNQDFSKTNKRITFIRNVIGAIIREAFRLTYMNLKSKTYDSHRDISHIPDATIHLCYLMYLYSFRSNVVTIFFDYPVYIVLMREMFMSKNLDIRRIDADICLMKYRYKISDDSAGIAKKNLLKYKSVIVKMRSANKLVKDVFLPVFGESFTRVWQSNP